MAGKDSFYEAYVSIIPSAKGFEKSLNKQLSGPAASSGSAAGGVAGGGFVAGFGKAVPAIAGVLAAAGIGDIIGKAIEDASTYQQASGAVESVFGQLGADAISAFADAGAKAVGQSANQILASASLLGVFGKAAGLAGDDLVDFSTDIITLGADLAAFGNTSPEEAVQALSAGLRGESEPLRKYGVLLDDAALKNRAMELGIYDGSGALTQQQRILAAHAEIMAQTTDQQGQFAAESDTLAGKQAILAASWENLSMKMGEAFLPMAEEVLGYLMDEGIPAFEEFVGWLNSSETKAGFQAVGDGAKVVAEIVKFLGVSFTDTAGLIGAVVGYLNGGISFEELQGKLQALPGFWGMVFRAANDTALGVGRSVGTMIYHVKQFASDVGRNVGLAINWFRQLPGRIVSALAGADSWLFNSGRAVVQGFVDGIGSMVGAVGDAISGVLDWAAGFFPNSPAERGPFSGDGWARLKRSGSEIAHQFASGIASEYAAVQRATGGLASAAVPSVGDTYVQNPFTGDYLLARTAEVASGVVSSANAALNRTRRGRVSPV